jgi:hypothetical protein
MEPRPARIILLSVNGTVDLSCGVAIPIAHSMPPACRRDSAARAPRLHPICSCIDSGHELFRAYVGRDCWSAKSQRRELCETGRAHSLHSCGIVRDDQSICPLDDPWGDDLCAVAVSRRGAQRCARDRSANERERLLTQLVVFRARRRQEPMTTGRACRADNQTDAARSTHVAHADDEKPRPMRCIP